MYYVSTVRENFSIVLCVQYTHNVNNFNTDNFRSYSYTFKFEYMKLYQSRFSDISMHITYISVEHACYHEGFLHLFN